MPPTTPNHDRFMNQSYFHATIRDRLRVERLSHRQNYSTPYRGAIRSFFKIPTARIAIYRDDFRPYDSRQISLGMEECFADWKLLKRGGERYTACRPWLPSWTRFEIAPGEFRNLVEEGTWFFQTPAGQRRVFSLDEGLDGRESCCLSLAYPMADEREASRELRQLYDWIEKHHYLRNATIRCNGTRILRSAQAAWDDVVLATTAQRIIRDNVRQFLELGPVFTRNGVPNRRGMLLYGAPGNGKTLIGRVLASTTRATFMYVTAADAANPDALREGFALARRLKPTIMLLEDLDLYAADRGISAECRTLGEILAQLDGLASNDGLMVIATTNDLTAIEPALRERPSRFDVVVEIGPPGADARRTILSRRLAKCAPPSPELLDEAVARTNGFSAAQVQEAAWRIIQQAILGGSLNSEGLAQPALRDLEAALPGLGASAARRRVGFESNGRPH